MDAYVTGVTDCTGYESVREYSWQRQLHLYEVPLRKDRLFGWHAALFPTGWSSLYKITVADWRKDTTGPMQVVSGPMGKEKVHYQAPSSDRIEPEMNRFFDWFENEQEIDLVLKAAIAHLWFVTIHPFDD